eukprot:TCONS_00002305-protein
MVVSGGPDYKVHWGRKLNGKCYQHFPVTTKRNMTLFLRVEDRNLLARSRSINCTKRKKHTVLITKDNKAYHIDKRGRIDLLGSNIRDRVLFPHLVRPPRGFNTKIFLKNPVIMDQPSLLQMVAESERTLEELIKIQGSPSGSGSIVEGIGMGLASVLEAAGSTGDKVISSLGRAIKDTISGVAGGGEKIITAIGESGGKLITSTGTAVKDSLTGVSFVFKEIFGGIPGMIIWVILLPLGVYVVYLRITGQIGGCRTCRNCLGTAGSETSLQSNEPPARETEVYDVPRTLEERMARPFPEYASVTLRPVPEPPAPRQSEVERVRRRRQLNRQRLNKAINLLDERTFYAETQ